MTVYELKDSINLNIRQQMAVGSISPDDVSDQMDNIADYAHGGLFAGLADEATITWVYNTGRKKMVTIAGDRTLSVTGTFNGDEGEIRVTQGTGGTRLLTLPGENPVGYALSTGVGHVDVLRFININGVLYWSIVNYGSVATDTTPPLVVSMIAVDSTHIEVTFDEVVTPNPVSAATGWSFKKGGVNLPITGGADGSGTAVLSFGFTGPLLDTDVFLASYDSATGVCADAAGNELVSFTDQPVTNSI